MTETDKAYLAGLIDGEGCILISKHSHAKNYKSPKYFLRVMIQMCELPSIKYISERFNKPYLSRSFPRSQNRKKAFYIYWNHRKAAQLLENILPYIQGKREQSLVALEFIRATYRGRNGTKLTNTEIEQRDFYYKKLQSLKKPYAK